MYLLSNKIKTALVSLLFLSSCLVADEIGITKEDVQIKENNLTRVHESMNMSEVKKDTMLDFKDSIKEDEYLKPMIEKLLQKLAVKYALFEDIDKNLSEEPLTNKEIDSIFITFSAEKEKIEKLEKALLKEKERRISEEKKHVVPLIRKNKYTNVPLGATPIYPRDKNNPLSIGPGKTAGSVVKKESEPLPNIENLKEMIPEIVVPNDFYITGISCFSKTCVAYTEKKTLKIGDDLFGEKILSITKNGIKIKSKKIPFN